GFYILFLQWREAGPVHAVLGFFFAPYMYIWGWINAKKLQIIDIMIFMTVVSIMAIAFITISTAQTAANALAAFNDLEESGAFTTTTTNADGTINISSSGPALGSEDAISMGSVNVGGSVTGQINDMFEVHEYTFNGSAGQTITIRGNATNGDDTDPRVNLFAPDGNWIFGDDDGGGDSNALISGYTLPSDGQYAIQVDGWGTGGYELIIN
ncbi:MAG: hypothetical protein DWQ04_08725, partial [Chloroflexi bacterium]